MNIFINLLGFYGSYEAMGKAIDFLNNGQGFIFWILFIISSMGIVTTLCLLMEEIKRINKKLK